jgi:hypothetical protein
MRDGTRQTAMAPYMAELTEGADLLRRHANPQMRLNVLLFSDPYEAALGLVPATGGLISTDGLSPISHPPLSRILGDATHILMDRDYTKFKDVYGAHWDMLNLGVVEQTKTYILYKIPEGRLTELQQVEAGGSAP